MAKETSQLHERFALRKLTTGLVSILIGFSFAKAKERIVQADTLAGNEEEPKINKNDPRQMKKFVKLGRIIPVDENKLAIKNAPTPRYRRDPQDPSKALPTKAPVVKKYSPLKKQGPNYNAKTRMVTPPADPRQDTELIYRLSSKKKSNPKSRIPNPSQGKTPAQAKLNIPAKSSRVTNYSRSSNSSKITESVQKKTRFFGFGRRRRKEKAKKAKEEALKQEQEKQASSQAKNANTNTEEQASTPAPSANVNAELKEVIPKADQNSSQKSKPVTEKKLPAKPNQTKEKSSKPAAKQKPEQPKDNDHHKKTPKNNLHLTGLPKIILNKETKVPPRPLIASLTIIDQDNDDKILTKLSYEGHSGAPIIFNNLIQVLQIYDYDGYSFQQLKKNDQVLPAKTERDIHFGNFGDDDVKFTIILAHRLVKVTPKTKAINFDHQEVSRTVTLTVNFMGAGDKTPAKQVQTAHWTRNCTLDLVTHKTVKGEFDTDWQADRKTYKAVAAPKIADYKAQPAQIAALPVTLSSITKTITYQSDIQEFAVDIVHPNSKVDPAKYQKLTSLMVEFKGAKDKTPQPIVEQVKWHRTLTVDQNGRLLTHGKFDSDWKPEKEHYQEVKVPVVAGYHADRQKVAAQEATQEDIKVAVNYAPNGSFIAVDQDGKKLADKQPFITDPNDPTRVTADEKLPQIKGYAPITDTLTPVNADEDMRVTYHSLKTAQSQDQNKYAQVTQLSQQTAPQPEVKTKLAQPTAAPQNKKVSFIIKFAGAGKDTPESILQLKDWPADQGQNFDGIKVPVVPGYHADQAEVKPQEVQDHNLTLTVHYEKNGNFIPVDQAGKQIAKPQPYLTDPADPSKVAVNESLKEIAGYLKVKDLTPTDAGKDLKVIYHKEPAKPEFVKVDVDHPHNAVDPSQYIKIVKLTVKFTGADQKTPADIVQTARLTRSLTLDQNGKVVANGKYTTDWQPEKENYDLVKVPVVAGYHADQSQIEGVPVTEQSVVKKVSYVANGHLVPVDESNHPLADPVRYITDPKDASKVAEMRLPELKGYRTEVKTIKPLDAAEDQQVVYNQLPLFFPVNSKHPNKNVAPENYEKTVRFTVTFIGGAAKMPKPQVKKAKVSRTLTVDREGKIVADGKFTTKWQAEPESYQSVKVPVIDGYHTDLKEVAGPKVTDQDIEKTVKYEPNGMLFLQDQNGDNIHLPLSFGTDPADPTKLSSLTLPKIAGFKTSLEKVQAKDPNQDQTVKYEKVEQFFPVNSQHPDETVDPKLYQRPVKFTVVFEGAEPAPKAQTQSVNLNRTITIDEHKKIIAGGKYTTDWKPEKESYAAVKVPVLAGYHTKIRELAGPKVTSEDQTARVNYLKNGSLLLQDTDGKTIGKAVPLVTDPKDPTKVLPDEKIPAVPGYEPILSTITPPSPNDNITVVYNKVQASAAKSQPAKTQPELTQSSQTKTAPRPAQEPTQPAATPTQPKPKLPTPKKGQREQNRVTFVQTIYFLDEEGNELHPAKESKLSFVKDKNGHWNKTIDTFALVTVPVVKGYYAEQKAVEGKTVMPDDDDLGLEIKVTYHKLGHIIPISLQGEVIANPNKPDQKMVKTFANDPNDATKALHKQDVPVIAGWDRSRQTVSPTNPAIDIPVMYSASKQKQN